MKTEEIVENVHKVLQKVEKYGYSKADSELRSLQSVI